MLRRREASALEHYHLRKFINAAEYFDEVVDKLKDLKEVLERKEEEFIFDLYYNSFDNSDHVIDFVLVFDKTCRPSVKEKVNDFLHQLVDDGFSTEGDESEIYTRLVFIRIHCPREKLVKTGMVLDMNLAFLSDVEPVTDYSLFFNIDYLYNDITMPKERSDAAQRSRESIFNYKPKDITNAERIMVIEELLQNTRYGSNDDEFGLQSLLKKKYLHACFPLHDGPAEWSNEGLLTDRQLLMEYWASYSNLFKLQPLNLINRYFGSEVAFYFAFLGFFIHTLILPSICGVIVVLYGLLTYADDRNYRSFEICKSKVIMCPPCYDMSMCTYEPLANECSTSQVAYIFDNFATSIYAIFWCLWATFSYTKWKRREAVLLYKWNLISMENDVTIRPEFVIRATRNKGNRKKKIKIDNDDVFISPENQRKEARFWRFLRYWTAGFVMVIVILSVFLTLYLAVVIRLYFGRLLGRFEGQLAFETTSLFLASMGNLLIVLFICIAEDIFVQLAHFVTDFENPRTQEQYVQSYIYKYSALCCVTSYSFLCYTAFFKGRFATYPGDTVQYKMLGILNYDLEKIHPPYFSVSYQWTMLTIGKEVWRLFNHLLNPYLLKLRRSSLKRKEERRQARTWDNEYKLNEHSRSFNLDVYMNVILQYGYLVLFPAAQPLGPLLYLFYNLWMLRVEAQRMLLYTRRVVPKQTHGLGPWLKIFKFLTLLGIGTNVFFLAFTSNLVPELCHWFNPYYNGYVNYTFSEFAVNDYPEVFGNAIKKGREGTSCFYQGFRFPPDSPRKYDVKLEHWNKISIRFLIVIIIQTFAIIFCGLIFYLMGGIPHFVKKHMKHRTQVKEIKREEKFKREKHRRETVDINEDIRKNFTVIKY